MIGIIYYFAALGAILSGSMLLPSLIAFGLGEFDEGFRILQYGFAGGFLSMAVLLAIVGRPVGLERRAAALLVVFSWLAFPALIALPIADITETGYLKALFQSVSSFTTTGSIVFVNLESVPRSIIFLLAQFQWMGGLATLVTFILILSPWEIGGLPKIASASETASVVASEYRLARYCGRLLRAFFGLTIICFVLLMMNGVEPFDAFILAMTALSTGGIVPVDTNLDLLLGNGGMVVMGVFLIIGATSIFWHRHLANLRTADLVAHRESYFVLGIWAGLAFAVAALLYSVSGAAGNTSVTSAVSEGIMNAASLVSTSGIQSRPGVFTLLAPILVLFLLFAGGGSFSTAGGVKLFRIGIVCMHARHELDRLIYPSAVASHRYSSGPIDLPYMKRIWGFISIWVLMLVASAIMLNISGLDFQAALTASAAAISNAGPAYGTFWNTTDLSGWVAYPDMSPVQLIILIALMLLGRLEIIVLVASAALMFRQFR